MSDKLKLIYLYITIKQICRSTSKLWLLQQQLTNEKDFCCHVAPLTNHSTGVTRLLFRPRTAPLFWHFLTIFGPFESHKIGSECL
jgi:hypothetical protein